MDYTDIPVVIAHFGNSPRHLTLALESAAKFNKTVVLIGDGSNKHCWDDHWDTTGIEFEKFMEFLKHYRQMSDYSKSYEMAFWRRIFALGPWMKERGCDHLFLLDSDVVTFADYSREAYPTLSPDCQTALMTPGSELQKEFTWSSSCHFSYWKLAALEQFTDYCIEAYANTGIRGKLEAKYQWHLDHGLPGGVCEMTLLYLWSRDNPKVASFSQVTHDATFDYGINTAANYLDDEYGMRLGLKHFTFRNGLPCAYNKRLKAVVRFWGIHCQGEAKEVMKYLCSARFRRFYYLATVSRLMRRASKNLKRLALSGRAQ